MSQNRSFETKFRKMGFESQRRYPNESLIAFLAANYFGLTPEKRKQTKMLEIGCGSGANLWLVAKEGFDAYGIDLAPTGIEYCRKMMRIWNVEADIRVGDMRRMDFPDSCFDLIFDVVSLQHLTFGDHLTCLIQARRCLKKGGRFFSYHLGENSISYRHGGGKLIDRNTVDNIRDTSMPLHSNGQTCFLSSNDAMNLLIEAGFQNIEIDRVYRTYLNQKFGIEYLVIKAQNI